MNGNRTDEKRLRQKEEKKGTKKEFSLKMELCVM